MLRATCSWLLVVLSACGRSDVMTGSVRTAIVFHGEWESAEQELIVAFTEALRPSGYFSELAKERGADPAFHVVASGPVALVIHVWASGAHHETALGLHGYEGRVVTVNVYLPSPGATLDAASFSLTHELVEAAADPWLTNDEIADPCEFRGYATLELAGAPRRVARYLTSLGCWPGGTSAGIDLAGH